MTENELQVGLHAFVDDNAYSAADITIKNFHFLNRPTVVNFSKLTKIVSFS